MKQKAYKAALREGAPAEEVNRLYDEWQESLKIDTEDDQSTPMAYLNGYNHPKLFTLKHEEHLKATRFEWGLIPEWTKSEEDAMSIRGKTLNARGESIFEKPSFKESAKSRRCLIFVDGFFEYQHVNGRAFPHFIQFVEKDRTMVFGGLWSSWKNPRTEILHQTVSIVTTRANELMTKIHNNPKLKEARMPLILPPSHFEPWLKETNEKEIHALIQPYPSEEMKSYTVKRLIGENGIGDSPEAVEPYDYPDRAEQGTLF